MPTDPQPVRLGTDIRLAVTGAGGFVGRRLVRRYIAQPGPSLLALARRPERELLALRQHARHRLMLFDLAHEGALQAALDQFEPTHVLHLAALSAPRLCEQDPTLAYEANVELTKSVLEAATAVGAKVLMTSTSQVYGRGPNPLSEASATGPSGVYGRTKLEAEAALLASLERGTRALIARPFNHAGPGQSEEFSLPAFAARLARGRGHNSRLPVGNLEARRDFLHVDDVLDAYELLLLRGQSGGIYNVCRGSSVRLGDLWLGLALRLGYSPEELAQRTFEESFLVRPGEADDVFGAAPRLSALGFRPARSIDKLLDDLVEPLL
jgi:GDP-4-dehydro-6-deoxy-D-mannose reductase